MSRSLTTRNRQELAQKQAKTTPHNADLVLADLSGSMNDETSHPGMSRWACLQQALKPLTGRVHVIGFNNELSEVDADELPRAFGGTRLALALQRAGQLEPLHVLVISDGQPADKDGCLRLAASLSEQCIIDALYIGPEDSFAIDFMQRLATAGGGRFQKFDLGQKDSPLLLGSKVSSMLALPDPDSVVKL